MNFIIKYGDNVKRRILTYLQDEYSFDVNIVVNEINFDIYVNKLNLTVVDKNLVIDVSGFCPYGAWIKSDIKIPSYKKGLLIVKDEFESGFSYGVNNDDWLEYVNIKTGWVCIGNPDKSGKAVEFVDNCVAVIGKNSKLISLWLKPEILPDL